MYVFGAVFFFGDSLYSMKQFLLNYTKMYLSPRTWEEEKEEDEVCGCGGGRHSVNSTHMHAHPFSFFPTLLFQY